MARARVLKPSFFLNTELADRHPLARLLFAGLWCHADRSGRLEDNPKKLKVIILPYDNCDIEKLLDSLSGFIVRYEVDQKRYIQIVNFEKHQHPHVKEQESTIPAPCKNGASMVQKRPLTLTLNPLTLTPNPVQAPVYPFEDIWKRYPNKDGRKDADRHFKATVKTAKDWTDINKALSNYLSHLQKETWKSPKNGSTWFNNWKDWIDFSDKKEPIPIDPEKKAKADAEYNALIDRERKRVDVILVKKQ